jgi:hypothetical protein
MRGETSSNITREPNDANTEASWHPVAAPPTTATDSGSPFIVQTSLWVRACSLPGKGILRAWPPTQSMNFSPCTLLPLSSAMV